MKILNVVGARPNFMKIAPLMAAMRGVPSLEPILLHTGQHYDPNMNQVFFDQLGIPRPDLELEVGSGAQAWQVAEIIRRVDPVLADQKPDALLVVGDVNSTVACALAASYRNIPVVHVEAGLRSFDWSMPEEINRVTTDRLSSLLFVTEPSARDNLMAEGVEERRIHFAGNVMADTLLQHKQKAEQTSEVLSRLKLTKKGYALVTLHRPSNVDPQEVLTRLLESIAEVATRLPVVFTVHPRTAQRIEAFSLKPLLDSVTCVDPLPYLDMVRLMMDATLVLTDSGGIQEETTVLGVPCLTLRDNTERPVTVDSGTNTLVGTDPDKIRFEVAEILKAGGKQGRRPEYWDGQAAERVVRVLSQWVPVR